MSRLICTSAILGAKGVVGRADAMLAKAIEANGAKRFTEPEAVKTGLFMEQGYKIMSELL